MQVNFDKFGSWEQDKAVYLLGVAQELGMSVSGYGELAVNPSSGNTYLWLEDYAFTLYMPITCELTRSDVWVLWTNPEDGEETEETLDTFDNLRAIEAWAQALQDRADEVERESTN